MVQSVELLLDGDAEARLRAEWAALAAAGVPSLADHGGATNRPHVTVAVAETGLEGCVDALSGVFRGWDLAGRGLAATVGAPLLFGGHRGRWVLARQVVPSRPLLTLHSAVHRAVAAAEVETAEQTRPDRWTPHVTLSRGMPAERMADALAVLAVDPYPCRFVGARLWDSTPKSVTALG